MEMHEHHTTETPRLQKGIKKFIPLLLIFSIIFLVTASINFIFFEPELMRMMRTFMGTFFIVFGLFKVARLKPFATAYQEYDIIAKRNITYSYAYPFIELGLGLAYFLNAFPIFVNTLTIIVMSVSALGVYLKLRKNEVVMCACLGTVFKIPMTWVTLIEDVLMAGMALLMLIL